MAFPTSNKMFGANLLDAIDGTQALMEATDTVNLYLVEAGYTPSPDMDSDVGNYGAGNWEAADGVHSTAAALTGTRTLTASSGILALKLDVSQTYLEWTGLTDDYQGLLVHNATKSHGIGTIYFGASKTVSGYLRYHPDTTYGIASLIF